MTAQPIQSEARSSLDRMTTTTPARPAAKLSNHFNAPTPVPLRPCQPWCESQDHSKEAAPDRHCLGPRGWVDLTLAEPVFYGDDLWAFDRIEALAYHWAEHSDPSVVLSHEGRSFEVSMRPSEARELATVLLAIADLIEADR